MSCMFYNCNSLKSLNLSNFDTSNVVDMRSMFYNCNSLNSLDISSFDTSQVKNMNNMFYNCSSLNSLDLLNFNTSNIINMNNMFKECNNLMFININISNQNSTTNDIFFSGHEILMVCGENNIDFLIKAFNEKIILCQNSTLKSKKCYLKNSILNKKYACNICEEILLLYHNNITDDTSNYYINCLEKKEENGTNLKNKTYDNNYIFLKMF